MLAARDRGMARQDVVATCEVRVATLKRWLVVRRKRDDLTPTFPPERQRRIRPDQHAAVWMQVAANRDATLLQHTLVWNETHHAVLSPWTIGRAIRRLGWTRNNRR